MRRSLGSFQILFRLSTSKRSGTWPGPRLQFRRFNRNIRRACRPGKKGCALLSTPGPTASETPALVQRQIRWESRCRKSPASVTTPSACLEPQSISFVTTVGLMSTQMVFTHDGGDAARGYRNSRRRYDHPASRHTASRSGRRAAPLQGDFQRLGHDPRIGDVPEGYDFAIDHISRS